MKFNFISMYVVIVLYKNSAARALTTDVEQVESATRVLNVTDSLEKCSKSLARAVAKLCNNEYKIVKRDTSSVMMEKLVPKDLQKLVHQQRLRASERWRRVRRQIADECCNRPCTIGHLIQYCHDDDKLAKENPDIYYFFVND